MPLYEYECTTCHRRTEKIQKYSDADLTVCPHCAGALERTITAAAVAFKGGGWFKDGYASAKPAANGDSSAASGSSDAGVASAGASDAGSSASGTSDSAKPAAAASAAPAAAPAATAKA